MKYLKGGLKQRGGYKKKPFMDKDGPSRAKPSLSSWTDQLDATMRMKLRDKGKCFYYKKNWE